eukprot:6206483-Pleurochrysis_carterae.AAC.1
MHLGSIAERLQFQTNTVIVSLALHTARSNLDAFLPKFSLEGPLLPHPTSYRSSTVPLRLGPAGRLRRRAARAGLAHTGARCGGGQFSGLLINYVPRRFRDFAISSLLSSTINCVEQQMLCAYLHSTAGLTVRSDFLLVSTVPRAQA